MKIGLDKPDSGDCERLRHDICHVYSIVELFVLPNPCLGGKRFITRRKICKKSGHSKTEINPLLRIPFVLLQWQYLLCFTVSVMRLSFIDSDVSLLSAILFHKISPTKVLGNLTLVDREYSSLAFGNLFFSIWEKSLPLSFSDGRYVQPYYLSWEKSLPSLSFQTVVWCFTLLTDLTKLVSSMVKLGYIIRPFFVTKRLIPTTSMECVYKSLASMAAH
ncbi:hypothetical protein AALP_AA5G035600 [Arabis alpina]|uniref:Uncharacterized protein n=1 Tax=Arabis alpina TaxID=50452 RepID=A0A087GUQ3_ARAAL|nr:hypothetical protein AALP_AA5G035600 [Arabis alpina]